VTASLLSDPVEQPDDRSTMAAGWDADEIERYVRASGSACGDELTVRGRAIALSLRDATAAGSRGAPIAIDDETIVIEDDDDSDKDVPANKLKRVLDLSREDVTVKPERPSPPPAPVDPKPASPPYQPAATAPAPGAASFLSERAKLEQARLERLKRLRPESAEQADPAPKRARSSPPESDTESDDGPPTRPTSVSPPAHPTFGTDVRMLAGDRCRRKARTRRWIRLTSSSGTASSAKPRTRSSTPRRTSSQSFACRRSSALYVASALRRVSELIFLRGV
jgi:hypothetical protein